MENPHTLLSLFTVSLLTGPVLADGEITSSQLIDDLVGGLGSVLADADRFGFDVDSLGDVDGDGSADLIVGAPGDGATPGKAWILFLLPDGTVKDTEVLPGTLVNEWYGYSVANLGDVDGDGVTDVAVGTWATGAYIHFLNADGSAKSTVFHPSLHLNHGYVGGTGDIDQDGVPDLLAGAPGDLFNEGELYVHLLNPDGTLGTSQAIAEGVGGFTGVIDAGDLFGHASTGVGDLDGDGVNDVAVSAPGDDDGYSNSGSIWILFLNADGTVKDEHKISVTSGDLGAALPSLLGYTLTAASDLDGDGLRDLVVSEATGFYVLFLRSDGSVRSYLPYDESMVGSSSEAFGRGTVAIPDLDGDGSPEFASGASLHDGGGTDRGGLYVSFWSGVSAAGFDNLGCDLNPAGSLTADVPPSLDTTVTFSMDNPLGTQNAGSLGFLAFSLQAATPAPGCGIPLPGYHMDPAQPNGELLIAAPQIFPALVGTPWSPGQPSEASLSIPHVPSLLGLELFTQGMIFDPTGGSTGTNNFGLTRGMALRIGT